MDTTRVIMSGNEAVARGAYEAGVSVASGYPGTPSTEILENLALYPGVYAEWAPNEKVALEVGFGASLAGARALVTMKHVGLNVAADPFMTLSYTGVNGGLVIVSADDPGMHSSQNEQDNRNMARFAKVPLLEPSDSREAREFLMEAYRISEEFDTPVLFRLTTRVAHTRSPLEPGSRQPHQGQYLKNIPKNVMLPAYARGRQSRLTERLKKLAEYAEHTAMNRIIWGNRKTGVIASGISFQYAREGLGTRASYLKLGMSYPLPLALIAGFAKQVEQLFVIEELDPFLEEQIRAAGIRVIGKEILPVFGELTPAMIRRAVLGEETARAAVSYPAALPGRPPILCPGCPHRAVFYTLHKLKAVVNGDIGCYTLGALPPFEAMDSCLCMGASIGTSLGMEKAGGRELARKLVSVIGDSTFIHSGITGLINQLYNQGTGTVVILDNRTTAMTGHQQHPATGRTLMGKPTRSLDLFRLVSGLGVEHVYQVDPCDLNSFEETLKREMAREELSVIIATHPCALIPEGLRSTPMRVTEACKKCKKCLSLGCPALSLNGERVFIDSNLCRGCGLCQQVCPSEAIETEDEA